MVDLSTAPPRLARRLYEEFNGKASAFADAPVARTRQAAIDGTLSIMVGGTKPTFERIEPLLRHMASEVTHCGDVGAGQTVKILNNMILFQTVVALAEGLSIARANGVDGKVLFETLTKGSADSFALRNHGMKALLPVGLPRACLFHEVRAQGPELRHRHGRGGGGAGARRRRRARSDGARRRTGAWRGVLAGPAQGDRGRDGRQA